MNLSPQPWLDALAERAGTAFSVVLPGGARYQCGKGEPAFGLVLRDEAALLSVLTRGHLGLLEAYFDQQIDVEGDLGMAMAAGLRGTEIFIRKHVFPGGWIPSLADVLVEMEHCGLEVLDLENLRRHYALTLDEWAKRFAAHWPRIQALDPARFDERFRRIWMCYLVGCAEMFRSEAGRTHLFQVLFSKGNATRQSYPMTREPVYR